MADVIQKIISGNDIRHGGATTGVPGNPTHTLLPNIYGGASVSEIESNLTNRFGLPLIRKPALTMEMLLQLGQTKLLKVIILLSLQLLKNQRTKQT